MGSKGLVLSFKLAKIEKLLVNQVGPYVTVYLYQVVRLAAKTTATHCIGLLCLVTSSSKQKAFRDPATARCILGPGPQWSPVATWGPSPAPSICDNAPGIHPYPRFEMLLSVTPMISFVPTGIFSAPPFLQIHQRSQFLSIQNVRVSTQDWLTPWAPATPKPTASEPWLHRSQPDYRSK